jgi:DNA-directed RNA polymerase subunit RPC12/RpoP
MNWFPVVLIILFLFFLFYSSQTSGFAFILLLLAVAVALYKPPEKSKKKPSDVLDFFTHKDTNPFEPYFDIIDEKALQDRINQILNSNLSEDKKTELLTQILSNQLSAKANLFIQNPTAAITLAAYYKVYKKLEDLEKKEPKAKVYWCPVCFRIYKFKDDDELKKYIQKNGGLYCEYCHSKLVEIKAPFTFNFLSVISAPFDTALETLIKSIKSKNPRQK